MVRGFQKTLDKVMPVTYNKAWAWCKGAPGLYRIGNVPGSHIPEYVALGHWLWEVVARIYLRTVDGLHPACEAIFEPLNPSAWSFRQ